MSKIQTYDDGDGVTTVAWMDADFNPVEPGSADAVYVKLIASSGEMSFYRVEGKASVMVGATTEE